MPGLLVFLVWWCGSLMVVGVLYFLHSTPNVAVILAQQGHRILAVDWDLEAPGLEEYFSDVHLKSDGRGLLDLLIERGDYESYLWSLTRTLDGSNLDLLPSGIDEEDYFHKLEIFNQDDFFSSGGGEFLETLREK